MGKSIIMKMTEHPGMSKGQETDRKETLRLADMAQLGFQYVYSNRNTF